MPPPRWFLLVYAASGAAALIYEVAWTRLLTLYLGHGVAAASTVLAAFMGGLAVGAAVAGPAERPPAPPAAMRLYAGLEIAIAALALLVPLRTGAATTPLLSLAYADGGGGLAFPLLRLAVSVRAHRRAGRGDGRHLPGRRPLVRARTRRPRPATPARCTRPTQSARRWAR